MRFSNQNLEQTFQESIDQDNKYNLGASFDLKEWFSYEDVPDDVLFLEDQCQASINVTHAPPFNFEKIGSSFYRLTILMVGVLWEHIQVVRKEDKLTVKVTPPLQNEKSREDYTLIYFGIFDILKPNVPFEFEISLPDGIEMMSQSLKDGLLAIEFQKFSA